MNLGDRRRRDNVCYFIQFAFGEDIRILYNLSIKRTVEEWGRVVIYLSYGLYIRPKIPLLHAAQASTVSGSWCCAGARQCCCSTGEDREDYTRSFDLERSGRLRQRQLRRCKTNRGTGFSVQQNEAVHELSPL